MTLTEVIELLENRTGLPFAHNKYNGQIESRIGDWRISISSLTDELRADPSEIKVLCATLCHGEWKTGQRFATYSVRQGLQSISDWVIGFRSALGFTDNDGQCWTELTKGKKNG